MLDSWFQFSVYTGQQLLFEALQRWLRPACDEDSSYERRRNSVKSIIVLLMKTAATGVVATILDKAIDYRRRALLAAAEEEAEGEGSTLSFSHLGLGNLTRAGIAAWKSRLLIGIDELERRAEMYGIEPYNRSLPLTETKSSSSQSLQTLALKENESTKGEENFGDDESVGDEEREQDDAVLSRTIQQLMDLVEANGRDATAVDRKLDTVVDELLLGNRKSEVENKSEPKRQIAKETESAGAPEEEPESCQNQSCHICMDRGVRVQVIGCTHELCFQCARRLCDAADHHLPQCPFCRRPIDGFLASGVV